MAVIPNRIATIVRRRLAFSFIRIKNIVAFMDIRLFLLFFVKSIYCNIVKDARDKVSEDTVFIYLESNKFSGD